MTTAHTRIDQYARRIAHRLDGGMQELPRDIQERLRAARERAVDARMQPQWQPRAIVQAQADGTLALHFGPESAPLWSRLASLFPLLVLVAGLWLLNYDLDDLRASELAEVDEALLIDDLPPTAYADPGFLQFLKTGVAAKAAEDATQSD